MCLLLLLPPLLLEVVVVVLEVTVVVDVEVGGDGRGRCWNGNVADEQMRVMGGAVTGFSVADGLAGRKGGGAYVACWRVRAVNPSWGPLPMRLISLRNLRPCLDHERGTKIQPNQRNYEMNLVSKEGSKIQPNQRNYDMNLVNKERVCKTCGTKILASKRSFS